MLLASARADRPPCKDENENCALWASKGECDANPGYMTHNCPVACDTCDKVQSQHDCNNIGPDHLEEGGIGAMFEAMLTLHQYQPKVLSRPPDGPWVVLLESFIDEEAALKVVDVGGHKFERSLAGYSNGYAEARTSSTSWCNVPSCLEDPTFRKVGSPSVSP